jgi:kynureninase
MTTIYEPSEEFAKRLDERDPLAHFRDRFALPTRRGERVLYFNGNSLGLMPKVTRELVDGELDDWASLAVDAHFLGKTPWVSYHEVFREPGARLVGALPGEVVMMNGLTVNLHLMMTTFFRPAGPRSKILMEQGAFPSDAYAAQSQLAIRGVDPGAGLIRVAPRAGEAILRTEDVLAAIERHGDEIALVLLPGVQYYTGQLLDIPAITKAARAKGCVAGWDLAHAAGNVRGAATGTSISRCGVRTSI